MHKLNLLLVILTLSPLSAFCSTAEPTAQTNHQRQAPSAIADLAFKDFYQLPAGPQGLEPSAKLQALNNKRVRIRGFMAHEDDPTAGVFLLSSQPANVAEKADGMADDLPVGTLTVYMPAEDKQKILTYRPGPWVLTGTLQLGNQEDPNGRISYVRLIMDKSDMPNAQNSTSAAKKTLNRAQDFKNTTPTTN